MENQKKISFLTSVAEKREHQRCEITHQYCQTYRECQNCWWKIVSFHDGILGTHCKLKWCRRTSLPVLVLATTQFVGVRMCAFVQLHDHIWIFDDPKCFMTVILQKLLKFSFEAVKISPISNRTSFDNIKFDGCKWNFVNRWRWRWWP